MQIFVPDIGGDEVSVTEILVKVGDRVELEQSLLTVEGDKASMEVPAPAAGTVRAILVSIGDKVSTGSLIMEFDAAAEVAPVSAPTAAPVATGSAVAVAEQVVNVPDIGGDEVSVTEILVKVGDTVSADQSILTVEGDKASMEVPAPFAGTVVAIQVAVGDKVSTGTPVMRFAVAGAATAPQAAPAQAAAPAASAPAVAAAEQIVNVPDIGGDEVSVTEILVKVGDTVSADQSILTVEGDKASMEVPAPLAGTVVAIQVAVGDKVKTGSPVMTFAVAGAAPVAAPVQVAPVAAPTPAAAPVAVAASAAVPAEAREFVANAAYVHATPTVRRLARELGVNLAYVKGAGRKGRIQKEDVHAFVKAAIKAMEKGGLAPAATASAGNQLGFDLLPWPKVDFAKFGEVEEVELTRIQKLSGPNLHRNWVRIPHVTQFDESDITEMEEFRKQQNALVEKTGKGTKLTPLVFILKAVGAALAQHPRFCSSLSEDGSKLIMKKYINVGVAVDTPNGLVVPVVRNVDQKGLLELSQELSVISKKAREGKLTGGDMQGGCFTISSLGGIGGTSFTPIVNAPEVAILGVSKSDFKPKWNGKTFEPRLMLPLALSYDHRVIDGADGARFITTLNNMLADIRRLVL